MSLSNNPSIGFLGFGAIGTAISNLLLPTSYDLYFYDTKENALKGKTLDLTHGRTALGSSGKIAAVKNPEDIFSCDIVVITAGKIRQKGMTTREELIQCNGEIIKRYALMLKEEKKKNPHYNPNIIIVTNPLDIMTYTFQRFSEHSQEKIMGMAGLLDSVRLRYVLSLLLSIDVTRIEGYVVGPHNQCMVPLRSSIKIDGISPSEEQLPENIWNIAFEETIGIGPKLSKLLSTEETQISAFLGPASCVYQMIQGLIKGGDKHPLCCGLEPLNTGGYLYGGAICSIGPEGVKEITIPLNSENEKSLWDKGIKNLKSYIQTTNELFLF